MRDWFWLFKTTLLIVSAAVFAVAVLFLSLGGAWWLLQR